MKTTGILLSFLLIAGTTVTAIASESEFDRLIAPYFETHGALARDNFDDARLAATRLAISAGQLEKEQVEMSGVDSVRGAAREMAFASDLKAAREVFSRLSELMISLADSPQGRSRYNIVEIRCSMAFGREGGSWLQNGAQAVNPYYGASMLGCGKATNWLSEGVAFASKPMPVAAGGCCGGKESSEPETCCATGEEK